MNQQLQTLKESLKPKAEKLEKLANEKEELEREIVAEVFPFIEEGYKNNDLKQVLDYINILPEKSYMRMMQILRYNKHISPTKEDGENKA